MVPGDLELLAIALIVALYLQDSLLLLYTNEAVLEQHGARRWRVRFGSRRFQLARREPLLPNPFTPWRIALRYAWSAQPQLPAAAGAPPDLEPEHVGRALRPVRPGLAVVAAGLFAGLPVCLTFSLGWVPFLGVVGVTYAGAAWMLAAAWRQRAALRVGRAAFAAVAAESLVCLPCALNLPRKLAARVAMRADLLDTVQAFADPALLQVTIAQIAARVDEEIAALEPGSAAWRGLTEYRARLPGQ